MRSELKQLDDTIASIRLDAGLEVFALNDRMLERSVDLIVLGLSLKPFDQAILAAVLVRAEELRAQGEEDLCFCETDSDLQPWDRDRNAKEPLKSLFDRAGVWVCGNLGMTAPERLKRLARVRASAACFGSSRVGFRWGLLDSLRTRHRRHR